MAKVQNWSILKHGTERSVEEVTKTRNQNALTKHRNGSARTRKTIKTRNGPAFFFE